MMATRFGSAGAIVILASFGCGTEPIPRVAAAGTTITIGIPGTYPVGFGRTLSNGMSRVALTTALQAFLPYQPSSGLEDVSRGELVFSLWTIPSPARYTYLPVSYITRVSSDASTPAGVSLDNGYAGHQVIAFVDIPSNVAPGLYTMRVERYRRVPVGSHFFAKELVQLGGGEWIGWGQRDGQGVPVANAQQGIPIEIVAGSGPKHNDFSGWGEFFGTLQVDAALSDDAMLAVPHPALRIQLNAWPNESPPAAIEFTIAYPRHQIEILNVELDRVDRSSALAILTPDTIAPVGCQPATGTVKVGVVDPEEATTLVELAYKLRNFATCGRLADDPQQPALVVQNVQAYDADGNPITPTTVQILDPAW